MAYDTWGGSWGASWGSSWTRGNPTPPVPPPTIGGGGGSGKHRPTGQRYVDIERYTRRGDAIRVRAEAIEETRRWVPALARAYYRVIEAALESKVVRALQVPWARRPFFAVGKSKRVRGKVRAVAALNRPEQLLVSATARQTERQDIADIVAILDILDELDE